MTMPMCAESNYCTFITKYTIFTHSPEQQDRLHSSTKMNQQPDQHLLVSLPSFNAYGGPSRDTSPSNRPYPAHAVLAARDRGDPEAKETYGASSRHLQRQMRKTSVKTIAVVFSLSSLASLAFAAETYRPGRAFGFCRIRSFPSLFPCPRPWTVP